MCRRALPLLLLVVASLGCGGKPAPETKPEPPPTTPAPTTAKSSDPNAPTADRTFAYWDGVARIQEVTARRYAALAEPKPDEVGKLLTDAAKQVDDLSAEKVDPDALAVGKGFAEALRTFVTAPEAVAPADAAAKARTTREAFKTKYGRDFPALDWAAAKAPVFRLVRDLGRPTGTQELARLKGEIAALDEKSKEVGKKLETEVTSRDTLQSAADQLRSRLKDQKEDQQLRDIRQESLNQTLSDIEEKKKAIEPLTKERNALLARRGELDRLAFELAAVLKEHEPEKVDAMPADRRDRLRTQVERLNERIDAARAEPPPAEPGKGK
jgi:hypothetical protein